MFRLCQDVAAHADRRILPVLRSALHAAPTCEQHRARLAEPCRKIQTGASVTLAASRWRQLTSKSASGMRRIQLSRIRCLIVATITLLLACIGLHAQEKEPDEVIK